MTVENKQPDPNDEILRRTDEIIIQAMGQEAVDGATRFLEARHALNWGQALDQPEDFTSDQVSTILSDHPGQTALTYRMSKAVGDEEREAIATNYVQDPASVTLPEQS